MHLIGGFPARGGTWFTGALVCLLASLWVAGADDTKEVRIEFRLAELEPAEGLTKMTVPGTGRTIYAQPQAALTTDDIDSAVAVERGTQSVLEIKLTSSGAKEFGALTETQVGKPVAVLIDGKLISAPVIQEPIRSGRAVISGDFTFETARRIAEAISKQRRKRNGGRP